MQGASVVQPPAPKISVGSRPRDLNAFGFGNVRTGQVGTRKMTFLTRGHSVGPEGTDAVDLGRAGLNPEVRTVSSARASPSPFEPIMKPADEAAKMGQTTVQWSQQSSAIAKTDFASSTKALGTGLARRSPAPLVPMAAASNNKHTYAVP